MQRPEFSDRAYRETGLMQTILDGSSAAPMLSNSMGKGYIWRAGQYVIGQGGMDGIEGARCVAFCVRRSGGDEQLAFIYSLQPS